jgi:pimeloyl-ACP methyl ester carboxylesterase
VSRLRRLLTLMALCATLLQPTAARAWAADGGAVPRFEPTSCPTTPIPVPALESARCGFLVVPENRRERDGRTIRLMVAIVPAASSHPAREPIVHLTGGPGGIALFEAQQLVGAGLNRSHALILMDQRGTFYDEPALTCPVIDEFNHSILGQRYDSELTRAQHIAATAACRQQLQAKSAALAAYNTLENADDFADLRRALGYDLYDLYGVSYGTDLALTIMRRHPEGIRSVVLDSVVPPHVAAPPGFWTAAAAGFGNLFAACQMQPSCEARYPHLERTFTELVRKLERDPVVATIPDPRTGGPIRVLLDGGALVNTLVNISFATPLFADVPSWIAQLAGGDPTAFARFRALVVTPPGFDAYGLAYGVLCAELVPFSSEGQVLRAGARAFPSYPKSVLAQAPQIPYVYHDCRIWNVPRLPEAREMTHSVVPTLLLSGSFDAVTPLAWAQAAASGLSNSTVVSIPGVGHFVLPRSQCAQSVVSSFLENPRAPDTGCVASLRPPVFS